MRALPLVSLALLAVACDAPPTDAPASFGLSAQTPFASVTLDPLGAARATVEWSARSAGVVSVFVGDDLHSIHTCQSDPRCLEAGVREVQLASSATITVMASSSDRVCLMDDAADARCAAASMDVEVLAAGRVTFVQDRTLIAPGEAALLSMTLQDAASVELFVDDASGRNPCESCQVTLDGDSATVRLVRDRPGTLVALAVSEADDAATFEDLAARSVIEVNGFPRAVSMAFSRAAAAPGALLTLSWQAADADSVLFAGGIDSRALRDCENQGTSGSCEVEVPSDDFEVRMIASRDGQSSAALRARVDVGSAPTASLEVRVEDDKRAIATWSTTESKVVSLVDLASGVTLAEDLNAEGGLVFDDIALPTRFELVASNTYGEARARSDVRVPVLPALPAVQTHEVALGAAFDLHTTEWTFSWAAEDADSVELKFADGPCADAAAFASLGVFEGASGDFAFAPTASLCVAFIAKNPFGQAERRVDVKLASPEFSSLFAPALGQETLPSEMVFVTGDLDVQFTAPGAESINLEIAPVPESRDCGAATGFTALGAFDDSGALSLGTIARDACLRGSAQNAAGRRAARTVRLVESPDLSAALGNVNLELQGGGDVFVESDVAGLVSLRVEVITLDAGGVPLTFSAVCNLESLDLDPEQSIPEAQIACRDVWDAQGATDCEGDCRPLPAGTSELVYAVVGMDSEGQFASTSVNLLVE